MVFDPAGYIPAHPMSFVMLLSEKLASFAPHLSVDFLTEVSTSLTREKLAIPQKLSCLQYMSPWIKNLNKFSNPASELYDSTTKLRDCFKALVELTLREQDVCFIFVHIDTDNDSFLDLPHDPTTHLDRNWQTRQRQYEHSSG